MISRTFVLVVVLGTATCDLSCPPQCNCYIKDTVDCSSRALTHIPTDNFDIDTKKIILSNNNVASLDANLFHKMGIRVLYQLFLDHNNISRIDRRAFIAQWELIEVDLSHNKIMILPMVPFTECRRLQSLKLSHNPLHTLDGNVKLPDTFTQLNLDHCRLEYVLSANEFDGNLTGVAYLHLETLRHLQIEGNPLRCNCRQVDTYRRLERLRLARDTTCGDSPEVFWQAILEKLDCSPCPQNCTCPTHSIANCSSMNLTDIPRIGFNHSVNTIVLSNNNISEIEKGKLAKANVTAVERILLDRNCVWLLDTGAFSGLNALRYLDLSHNALRGLSKELLEDASLCGLESLLLSHNQLSHVADGAFACLSRLRHLDLSHNQLSILSSDALESTTNTLVFISVASNDLSDLSWLINSSSSLREVNASDNQLKTLSTTEVAALSNLSTLQLTGNPFHCDSALVPAFQWLESRALARDTRCYTPAEHKGRFWQILDSPMPQPDKLTESSTPKPIKPSPPKTCPPQPKQSGNTQLLIAVPVSVLISGLFTFAAVKLIPRIYHNLVVGRSNRQPVSEVSENQPLEEYSQSAC